MIICLENFLESFYVENINNLKSWASGTRCYFFALARKKQLIAVRLTNEEKHLFITKKSENNEGKHFFFSGQSTKAFSPPPPLGLVDKRTFQQFLY